MPAFRPKLNGVSVPLSMGGAQGVRVATLSIDDMTSSVIAMAATRFHIMLTYFALRCERWGSTVASTASRCRPTLQTLSKAATAAQSRRLTRRIHRLWAKTGLLFSSRR